MTETIYPAEVGTKALALQLAEHPIPSFSIADLMARWSCSRSTVHRFRDKFDLHSISHPNAHPEYDLCDVLFIEGVTDPVIAWAFGTDTDRKIFSSRLLTLEDLMKLDRKVGGRSEETFRRQARAKVQRHSAHFKTGAKDRQSFKLGHCWMFRPIEDDLPYLTSGENNSRGQK
jgi:hypothetical protein